MKAQERKKLIFDALVNDYIDKAEAVSSKALVDKTGLDISSATMRNDLASLEYEGLVRHLHTSSGRVPTDKGYRYYVDNLSAIEHSNENKQYFERSLADVSTSIDKVLSFSAQILSSVSKYPVILVSETQRRNVLKLIHLVLLNVHQVLLVVLNNYGENYEEIIELKVGLNHDILNKINEHLNNALKDTPIENLGEMFENNLEETLSRFSSYQEVLSKIVKAIKKNQKTIGLKNIIIENEKKLLSFPEFQDIEVLKKIHSVLEDEQKIVKMFDTSELLLKKEEVISRIGSEHQVKELDATSLVFSSLDVNGEKIANIGVLGPTRMKYDNIITNMRSIVQVLCKKIEHLFM